MSTDTARVAGVRQFNRFYTRQIGLLRDGLLGTPFSLTEGRVLYELGQARHRHGGRACGRSRHRSRLSQPPAARLYGIGSCGPRALGG